MNNSRKAKLAGFIVALIAGVITIVGCGADLSKGDQHDIVSTTVKEAQFSTTAPYTVTSPPPTQKEIPVTDGEDAEGLYLALLESFDAYLPTRGSEDAAVKAGWSMCNAFDNATVTYGMLLEAGTATQTTYDQADVENIIFSAVMALCPEHMDRLPE